jgi:tetratricopeptide (TPR) repeat protein
MILSLALTASAQQGKDQPPSAPNPASSGESSSRQNNDQKPSAPSAPSAGESSSRPASQPAGQPPAAKPDADTYDPVSAQDDIDVGVFYMHKGDLDAAISRFQDAIRLRSNFAKPRLLLAEAYEKKGDKIDAVKSYKEYLQVFPKAPDAKKIQNKIEKLSGE